MEGMSVYVYRNGAGDCTNGGISSRHDRLTLVGKGIPKMYPPTDKQPGLLLKNKPTPGSVLRYWFAVPIEWSDEEDRWLEVSSGVGPMFGGNFVYSTDSRFRTVCPHPIPVHDRFETQAEYNLMTAGD